MDLINTFREAYLDLVDLLEYGNDVPLVYIVTKEGENFVAINGLTGAKSKVDFDEDFGDRAFHLRTEELDYVYLPPRELSPKYYDGNKLSLKGLLALFEETFHALDRISENRKTAETLAAIGRYYMIKLFKKRYNLFDYNSLQQLFTWVTGYKVEIEDGKWEFYYDPNVEDEGMYTDRIPLTKALYEIEKKSWDKNYTECDLKKDLQRLIREVARNG